MRGRRCAPLVGRVEWGATRAVVDDIMRRARTVDASPFTDLRRRSDVVWLRPTVRANVTFSEMVEGMLCDPVLRGTM